ncbi:MAG: HEAT repeat domain-containing protein, partial [Acidobacteria bacterium]|nr:HEAT repeat domain-containing protein [Acidobacteriota bacterium]
WPARDRPLLRPLLVRALVGNGSVSHDHEFMDLALGKNPEDAELALEAVTALGTLADDTAIPLLLRLSRDKAIDLAVAAVRALGEMGHAAAVPPLVHLSRGKGAVAKAAVWSLARFQHPESLRARLRLVDDEGTPDDIRKTAMETLGPEDDPGIFPALRAVITGTRSPSDPLVRAAWRALRLNAALENGGEAMRFLESHANEKIIYSISSCGLSLTFADEDAGPPQLRVTPAAGHTLRCWAGPGLTLEFEDELGVRVPSGWPIALGDLYEGPDEILVRPEDGGPFEDCWLPLDQLQWRELTAAENEPEYFDDFWMSPTSAEFDIPLHESLSETALLLQDADLIEFFDPGPESIGAALVLDGIGSERRDLLLLLSEAGDAPLLQEALEWAWEELSEEDDTED